MWLRWSSATGQLNAINIWKQDLKCLVLKSWLEKQLYSIQNRSLAFQYQKSAIHIITVFSKIYNKWFSAWNFVMMPTIKNQIVLLVYLLKWKVLKQFDILTFTFESLPASLSQNSLDCSRPKPKIIKVHNSQKKSAKWKQ